MAKPTPSPPPPYSLLLFGHETGPRKGSWRYPGAGDRRMKDKDTAVAPAETDRRPDPPLPRSGTGSCEGEEFFCRPTRPRRATKLLGFLAPTWVVRLAPRENLWPHHFRIGLHLQL